MRNTWNTQYIRTKNLQKISRGRPEVMLKYLQQFQQLIPERIAMLKDALKNEDRDTLWQTLHQLSPQLHFFGITEVAPAIQKIAKDYQRMPWRNFKQSVEAILEILQKSLDEVAQVIRAHF